MRRLVGAVADSLLALQRACLPSTAWLPRFLQAKRLIDTSAGHTLDASCGNGDFTVWMAQQGMRITGVDFSAHELELAQARARDTGVSIDFEVCDLANAHGLPNAGFDQILSLDTIVHIPDDGAVFDTFARVLKPGGRLVASLAAHGPSGGGSLYPVQRFLRRAIPKALDGPPAYNGLPWLRAASADLQEAMSQHRYYQIAPLLKKFGNRFSLLHYEYGLHFFTAVVTDLVFGLRYGRFAEPAAFYAATHADRMMCAPKRPGYLLWVVLQRNPD